MSFQADAFQNDAFQIPSGNTFNDTITLALTGGFSLTNILNAVGSMNLGLTGGFSLASAQVMLQPVSLALASAFGLSQFAALGASLSLPLAGGFSPADTAIMNAAMSLPLTSGFSPLIVTGNTYQMTVALGVTAGIKMVELLKTPPFRFRPIRFFLSRRYRAIALAQPVDPEDSHWDWH